MIENTQDFIIIKLGKLGEVKKYMNKNQPFFHFLFLIYSGHKISTLLITFIQNKIIQSCKAESLKKILVAHNILHNFIHYIK